MHSPSRLARVCLSAGVLVLSLALAPAAAAHSHHEVGEYGLTVGWADEPTFVGQPNAVELTIELHDTEAPVEDLADGALTVVVTTAGQDTAALPLEAAFGSPGVYEASLLPTVPGEYTFHFVGTINDQAVDLSVTSGDDTFSSVRASTDVEFPVQVPTLADVATRLERIDGRIEELQTAAVDPQDIAALQTAVADAKAAADRASTMGLLVGGAGLVVAIGALWFAMRAGRRGTGSA